MPEDKVGLPVSTASIPPPLNDNHVVAIELDVCSCCCVVLQNVLNQEFKANRFCPANVPSISFLSWDKLSHSPAFSNCDSNANTRAGVRVCVDVDDGCGFGDWPFDDW